MKQVVLLSACYTEGTVAVLGEQLLFRVPMSAPSVSYATSCRKALLTGPHHRTRTRVTIFAARARNCGLEPINLDNYLAPKHRHCRVSTDNYRRRLFKTADFLVSRRLWLKIR